MRKSIFPFNFGILMSLAVVSMAAAQTTIPAPTIYPPSGTYQSRLQVSLFESASGNNTEVYYTTDGSTPSPTNRTTYQGALTVDGPYIGAITVNGSVTLKAIAYDFATDTSSTVTSVTYVIKLPAESPLPVGDWTSQGPTGPPGVNCGGPGSGGDPGSFGKMGVPTATNIPSSRTGGSNWTDDNGNLWLFGGHGYDSVTCDVELNDLWMFNISTQEWTWMGGSSAPTNDQIGGGETGDAGVYGTLGEFAAANMPGSRNSGVSWTDRSGNLWLFGGEGLDSAGTYGSLNDVWEYNPSTHQWAWMAGSKYVNERAYFDSFGVFHSGNTPGARYGAVSFTDSGGNFWLFGGDGYDAVSNEGYLCDIWEFNPSTRQWAWMGGSHYANELGTYNTLGVSSQGGHPGGRSSMVGWVDNDGNFWIFGGFGDPGWENPDGGPPGSGGAVALNDLWKFNTETLNWTWMSGYDGPGTWGTFTTGYQVFNYYGMPGVYGTLDVPDPGNNPGSRGLGSAWTDEDGNLWLYGGEGFDAVGQGGYVDDTWEFKPSTGLWSWMGGDNMIDGGSSAGANPGTLGGASSWTDKAGNFWLFGGSDFGGSGNELYKYQAP
jgi:N-acetylneuraminic acid mutarotase